MAQRAGRLNLSQRGHSDLQANGEAPASTLAAQIVDNLTSSRRRANPGGYQAHLRQLLQMVLDADQNEDANSGVTESSIDENRRLICIIVKAGLEVLSSSSPFDDQGDVHTQALNTLSVVEITIRRCPEVLFSNSSPHEPAVFPKGQLFLWLFPQFINLLSRNINQQLRDKTGHVLHTALTVQTRATTSKIRLYPILKYLQGCVKDLIVFVEVVKNSEATVSSYRVPTDETLLDAGSQRIGQTHGSSSFLISHEDISKDILMAVHLLEILTRNLDGSAQWHNDRCRPSLGWIVDHLMGIWQYLEPTSYRITPRIARCSSYFMLLRSLRNCIGTLGVTQYDSLEVKRLTTLLCICTSQFLQPSFQDMTSELEELLCWFIHDMLRSQSSIGTALNVYQEHLTSLLLATDGSWSKIEIYGADLQRALALSRYHVNGGRMREPLTAAQQHLIDFEDISLRNSFCRIILDPDVNSGDEIAERPEKRRRISSKASNGHHNFSTTPEIRRTREILNTSPTASFSELCNTALSLIVEMPDDDQCIIIRAIGQVVCINAHTWIKPKGRCSVCDYEQQRRRSESLMEEMLCEQIFQTIRDLLKLLQMQRSTKARIATMMTAKRLLSHTCIPKHLDMRDSLLGQWCLQAFKSSLRDLRISAGRTLMLFLQDGVDDKYLRQNRVLAFDLLQVLSEKSGLALQETCILTWGWIAKISSEDEINIVLLRLVEYLGHNNPLISALAYDELLRVTNHSSAAAMRMFVPYWRTLAITIVKDLHSRPQISQRICDLLNVNVNQFLQLTQFYTIPYLILTKKRDILQKIADGCEPKLSICALCMGHTQLAAILANLLLQPWSDLEPMVMSLLCFASPEFNDTDFQGLIRTEPMLTAFELLKIAGDEEDGKAGRVHQAIHYLAQYNQRRPGSTTRSTRQSETVGDFFEHHVLAIMALLSETIGERNGLYSVAEKKRSIGAIRELIRLAKGHVSNALPQICACLQSAVENTELCNEAFNVWIVLLTTLGEDDVENLINPTFAIIAEYWNSFNSTVQSRTHDMISLLVKTHASMVREMVIAIPALPNVPLLSKFENELSTLRAQEDPRHQFQAFTLRCLDENSIVVLRALNELEAYLMENQSFLQNSAISEQPDPVISQLIRALLDACVRFGESSSAIAVLCARCLGLIGCLDPTRIEAIRESNDMLVLSNFEKAEETIDFVIFFFQEVLVKAFLSATNTRAQTFLGYVIQELLRFCAFDTSVTFRGGDAQLSSKYRRWIAIPEAIRNTLTPFLTSQYILTTPASLNDRSYPIYRHDMSHPNWLRDFVFDLLRKGSGENAAKMFPVLRRAVRGQDISIPSFLLPFATLNIVVGGTDSERRDITQELLEVLCQPVPENNPKQRENMISCSQDVFHMLDYFSRWIQAKKKEVSNLVASASRADRPLTDSEMKLHMAPILRMEEVLAVIPPEDMSKRAMECKSYSRSLFYWEQFIRQQQSRPSSDEDDSMQWVYQKLQDIYTQIDEPDGIEGISSRLHVLNIDQQVLEHRKAGRWTAVQSWYELRLTEEPSDIDAQLNLLISLKESGQFDALLSQIAALQSSQATVTMARPFAVEASWVTRKWDKLTEYLANIKDDSHAEFNIGVGAVLQAMHMKDFDQSKVLLNDLRCNIARSMSVTTTASLQACHEVMLKFHILTEVELIGQRVDDEDRLALLKSLNQRLEVIGAFLPHKQYLLGLRRAAMQLSRHEYSKLDLSSAWLTSARLARKGDFTHQAFNAVLHASQLGDESATIEHSRLLWKEGSHRKAIQSLEGAIEANAFRSHNYIDPDDVIQQNLLTAKAHLLLAKWVDRAGQTQSDAIISRYKKAVEFHSRWEKGHYYLGKHYNKLLESEKIKPPAKQAQTYITGETAKLVIENYLRSLAFGAKYIFQTLPRILTLWLDLGNIVDEPLDPKYGNEEKFRKHIVGQRQKLFGSVNSQIKKYIDRLPPFVFYTAFAQIVARICHSNQTIYGSLVDIIAKVVTTHPQQALWTLLALVKSSSRDRSHRGAACMTRIVENAKKLKVESAGSEVKTLINHGQKLSDQLLHVCEGDIAGKATIIGLSKDLRFNQKTAAPCRLVIPLEATLMASLPTVTNNVNMKLHKAFTKETITISAFLEDVLVLNSLQRPRKISIRGSDGHVYGLLCKPKDDLRKDQRLMEFNNMINRSLKRDSESSKRRLYIKTYAVTPLNEECGLIEWVDNLKTLRDILNKSYKQRNIDIPYLKLKDRLNKVGTNPENAHVFHDIIRGFPPVFYEWFVEMFPEPSAWFTARLKYTRSCAVMSIVGHVLGLGDRHGENILFEEGNGGTLHVDFNCLFDKGLTFEKPELVPFRLTHNMIDAFGAYGYDGPFRKSCELTLEILRQNEDTLMTILETFVYDPTTDFLGKKKRSTAVPDTPEGVLESVRSKVRGLLPMESVPLSVEGYVDELINQATDPIKLASMYIGWCAFF